MSHRLPLRLVVALATLCMSSAEAQQPTGTELRLDTGTGTLVGSLIVPAVATPMPVALIIAGSGPTDRNGNSPILPGKNNSNLMLAQALAGAGIASLRYDKRGIAASAGAMVSESALRFDTYVDDASKWVALLGKDPRFSTITIIGHSEGSLIGMIAARLANADGYVSVAGAGRGAADIVRDQLKAGVSAELYQQSEVVIAELAAGRTYPTPPPALAGIFRPSVQPYIISWFGYVPATEVARLRIPVLIAQGTTDIQVQPTEATLLQAAKPDAKLVMVDGMNHVLKQVPAEKQAQVASYSDSTLALSPQFAEAVIAFINGIPPRSHP